MRPPLTSLTTINLKDLRDKTALLRVDLNLPLNEGVLLDDSRLKALSKTLKALKEHQVKIILLSHFGRPKGTVVNSLSLKQVLPFLQSTFPEIHMDFCPTLKVEEIHAKLQKQDLLLLENVRFDPRETSKIEKERRTFAKELAVLGDLYINDAFSASHRHHATITELAQELPAFIGFSFEEEVREITHFKNHSPTPRIAFLGGGKVSGKLEFIQELFNTVKIIALGGGLANTFLKARGIEIGDSLYEPDLLETARAFLTQAQEKSIELLLPLDATGIQTTPQGEKIITVDFQDLLEPQSNFKILDIGPKTQTFYKQALQQSKSVLWNGPLGLFERPPFDKGSFALAQAISEGPYQSLIGGGETLALLKGLDQKHTKALESKTFCSKGGGAFLDFYANGTLPGLEVLKG